MKNIHVIPTDKPSRLYLSDYGKELNLSGYPLRNYTTGQHIYITSDEEIKEGDWFTDDNNSLKRSYKLSHVQFANPKKIILTTDQDLIKDGVQAIDDEFLEWFVKNPSCESVEIESEVTKNGVWTDLKGYVELPTIHSIKYKIIIPKEEPKQETLDDLAFTAGEEAFKEFKKGILDPMRFDFVCGFTAGAKWQAEKMYSEEEVFSIIDKAFHMYASSHRHDAKEWFEKCKKK
jgi:hypothetical protein